MAFSVGAFLQGVVTEGVEQLFGGNGNGGTATPSETGAVVAGVPNAGGNGGSITPQMFATLKPEAITVLRMIGEGSGDAEVRQAARDLKVGKKDLFKALTTINILGRGALTRMERIAISDQIEKIFRTRRRGPISKSMKRAATQMTFWLKFARKFGGGRGHAHFTTTTKGHK